MSRGLPVSVLCIIAAEFCERFSFCGLRTILSLYLRNALCLHENGATVVYHIFIMMCYTTPLLGAILADNYMGRYKVILYFSIIYLLGAALTCCAAIPPLALPQTATTMTGLALIALGSGAIKPCVAAFGGDQFHLPEETQGLQKFFAMFYCTVNLGGFVGMVVTPALRHSVTCFGDDTCYALGFGFPATLLLLSILIFVAGKSTYRIKQPRDNVTIQVMSCACYAIKKRFQNKNVGTPAPAHWLDYSLDKYSAELVADMKLLCTILYLYLPVPIFWSLFDQQGSRWTFQASRLHSEVYGVNLMPDQLQVLNPALVLLMIPVCPGGSCPILPDLKPLTKMFVGGVLAALAFVCAGILQIGIERSTLQVPDREHSALALLNTLECAAEVAVGGSGVVPVERRGAAVLTPLPHQGLRLTASCQPICYGRRLNSTLVHLDVYPSAGTFTPIAIGQNSADDIELFVLEPDTYCKTLTGRPKLKLVYLGKTGADKNVSMSIESRRLTDTYYVSSDPADDVGESAYMALQPGRFGWRVESADGLMNSSGEGLVRGGGVYALAARERGGRLDALVLHAPNPPNELDLAWIVPQYFLISVAEIMFAVSGLEFSFTQAPKSMKTITIAAWYVSVAYGNMIVIIVAQMKLFQSRATELFGYAAALACAMAVFLALARNYSPRPLEPDASSAESAPLLHHRAKVSAEFSTTVQPATPRTILSNTLVISVHSLSALSSGSWSGGRAGGGGAGGSRARPLRPHATRRLTLQRR